MNIYKRLVGLAGVLAMVGTACSDEVPRSGAPSPSGCGLEALAAETGPVDVSVWHFFPGVGSGAASPVFADLVDRFNRSQQKVRVADEAGLAPPFVGPQARLGQELGPALDEVFGHRATPEEALARAAAKADRHLADYNDDPGDYVRWLTGS